MLFVANISNSVIYYLSNPVYFLKQFSDLWLKVNNGGRAD